MGMASLQRSLVGTVLVLAVLATPGLTFAASLPSSPTPAASPTPVSSSTPRSTAGVTKVSKQVVTQAVSHLLSLINADRVARHVAPLALDASQSICSKKHSIHMQKLKTLTHDQFPADICTPYRWTGENVGEAAGDPVAAVTLLNQLMMNEGPCPHSSCPGAEFEAHGHYVNIVDRHFKRVGIGLVVRDGTTWVTENFTG